MKRIGKIAGETGAKLCDRGRSVKLRVLDIARAARSRAKQSRERLNRAYGKLLNATSRVASAVPWKSGQRPKPKRRLLNQSASQITPAAGPAGLALRTSSDTIQKSLILRRKVASFCRETPVFVSRHAISAIKPG
jgi:hypothetical protein